MHFLLRLCACVGVFFKTHWIAALDLLELVKGARESEEECPKVSASRPVTVPCCFFYKRSDASIINLSNLMLPPPNLKKNKRDRHNRIALHSNWISRPFDLEKIRADDVTLFRLIEIEWHVFINMRRFLRSVFRLFPQNEAKARTRQLERNNDNKFQGIGRETKEVRNIRDHDQWKREMSSHSYVYTFSIFFFLPPEDLNDSTVKHEFPRLVARDERWRPTCSPDTFHSIFLSRVSPPSSYSALHHHVIISIRKKREIILQSL